MRMDVLALGRIQRLMLLVLLLPALLSAQESTPATGTSTRSPLDTVHDGLTWVAREAGRLAPQVGALATDAIHTVRPLASTTLQVVVLAETVPRTVNSLKAAPAAFRSDPTGTTLRTAGNLVQSQVGFTSRDAGRVRALVEQSPAYKTVRSPFSPGNLLLAVGVTAGANLAAHVATGDDKPLTNSLQFLKQKEFWGGLVGSGVGYSVASMVAMHLIPAGPAILPTIAPLMAGLAGSQLGWEVGAGVLGGQDFKDVLRSLSPGKILGQTAGSTLGMFVGANLATLIGGTLGGVVGPVGAIAGAMIVGQMGAKLGEELEKRLRGQDDELDGTISQAQTALGTVQQNQQNLNLVLPTLSSPRAAVASNLGPVASDPRHAALYRSLEEALRDGRRDEAARLLGELGSLSGGLAR